MERNYKMLKEKGEGSEDRAGQSSQTVTYHSIRPAAALSLISLHSGLCPPWGKKTQIRYRLH